MRIHDSGNARHRARDFRGQSKRGIFIRSRYPDIDGRRLTEIEDLIDDIGRLEEELQFGKPRRKLPAQHGD